MAAAAVGVGHRRVDVPRRRQPVGVVVKAAAVQLGLQQVDVGRHVALVAVATQRRLDAVVDGARDAAAVEVGENHDAHHADEDEQQDGGELQQASGHLYDVTRHDATRRDATRRDATQRNDTIHKAQNSW